MDCIHSETLDGITPGSLYEYYLSGGLAIDAAYPMSRNRGAKCLFNYTMDGIQLLGTTGYRHIPTNDEEQLKRAVRQMGPVTVMFKITPNFFSYRDGVYQGSANCK